QVRATPTYYTHHIVRSGYTNRGEVIGAVVGPGGNGQYLDVDVFTPRGRLGLFVSRVVRDNDAYYANRGGETFRGHDVTLTTGLVIARQRDPWRMEVRLARMRDYNRYFMVRNDVTNWHVALDLVWLP
ncbi:MAG TPA: hypothetical protein VNL98_12100, partial [Gemmatimonadales bacterium]|nr:hypothetical protein [Gemmatimonadales bacterium]